MNENKIPTIKEIVEYNLDKIPQEKYIVICNCPLYFSYNIE